MARSKRVFFLSFVLLAAGFIYYQILSKTEGFSEDKISSNLSLHPARSVRRNPGPSGSGQDELSQLGRKASLDASHPQTDEESPP